MTGQIETYRVKRGYSQMILVKRFCFFLFIEFIYSAKKAYLLVIRRYMSMNHMSMLKSTI